MSKRGGALALSCAAVVLMAGCSDAGEQRPLELEPGVYMGQQDEPLSEDLRKSLSERAAQQGG